NCTATYAATITQPAALIASSSATHVSCNGGANGSINLTVNGGTMPYTYSWGAGVVSQNRTGLVQGTYVVTITDNLGCSLANTTTINQPAAIITSSVVTNATCNGFANGAVDLTATGGTGSLAYIWSNGAVTQDITSIVANTYTVTVTDAANCTVRASATVTESAQIVLTTSQVNVSCFGGNNGSIDLTVTGGTGVYTYNWSNGAVAQDISGLVAQSYAVTVSDNNSCSSTATVAITHPAVFAVVESHTNITCNGGNNGTITLIPSGGTMPYTFNWGNNITAQNRTGLTQGSYAVTASDVNGCSATAAATLTQPTAITLATTKTDVTCAGTATGNIDLTVSGGTGNYLYQWTNGAVTQDLASVAAGSYTVTVTDAAGCTLSTSTAITQPTPITISFSLGNVTCYGGANGSINTVTSGGNGGYVYNWSNGLHTPAISGLIAGNYSLSLNDASNCATTLSFNVTQPAQMLLTETHTGITCNSANSGSINLTVAGGAFPYSYAWSNGVATQDQSALGAGAYSVVVTDQASCTAALGPITITQLNGLSLSTVATDVICNGAGTGSIDLTVTGGNGQITYNWSNGATTQDIAGVVSGTYRVTVTDANACSNTTSAIVNQSSGIQVTLTKTDATCFGAANGNVNVVINGGNNGYTYNWSNGATTPTLTNVAAGNYTVTVRDAQSCSVSSSATVGQPTQIAIAETHVNVSCNGNANGSIQTTVSGGAGGYTYQWSTSATSATVTNLAANSYSLTVTDAASCSSSTTINIAQPAPLSLNETHQPYACNGRPGSIDLQVQGGTAPYNYAWSGGVSSQDRSNLQAGTYTVTVNDVNSCNSSMAVTINQLQPLSTSINKTDVTCHNSNNGAINLTVTGGTAPYTFNWNNGATTASLINLAAAAYRVVVIDSNNCNTFDSTTINQPSAIQLSGTTNNVSCFGLTDGSVSVAVSGGFAGYTYLWNTQANTANLSNLASGSYPLTVTDGHSCSASQTYVVGQPQPLTIAATVTPVACAGRTDGQVQIQVNGGVAPFTYNWANASGQTLLTNLAAGNYDVTVVDNSGCSVAGGYIIGTMPAMVVSPVVHNASCAEVDNGSIDLAITGGTAAYAFDWSNDANTSALSNLAEGAYAVTVTDARNCSVTADYTITNDYTLTVDATQSTTINLGEAIQLNAVTNVNHGNVYTWSPANTLNCGNCASPEATPTANTFYTVNVVDANGCRALDTLTISVNSITDIFIPNAFSPNGDGNNDAFQLFGDISSIAYLDLRVFNRWGEMVFESNKHNFTWDGTYKGEVVPQGVYIYT
ncbi:MAG TPA: gliding motility-associated C-terminal domain-containing protein, partial [Chitinophagales bacterium]|nr:gliding motility-associated C-terminal domain-containing protein [Chitinophagales bacterium]